MTMTFSWIARFSGDCLRRRRRGGAWKLRPTRQPRLESLEGRVVPSTTYQVIDLGSLGGRNAEATALNNQGEVVGYSDARGSATYAFRDVHGKMISLGSTLNGASFASSINNRGQIVGSSINLDGSKSQAFLYSNGRMAPIIGKLPGMLANHQTRPWSSIIGTRSSVSRPRAATPWFFAADDSKISARSKAWARLPRTSTTMARSSDTRILRLFMMLPIKAFHMPSCTSMAR